MTVKQLSVFVENRPGRLCAVTEALAEADINIRAVSIADTKDFGIMRIIVNDADKAVAALKEKGFIASAANVIAVIADDKPGSMASIMKTLYKDNISVEYMYAAFINGDLTVEETQEMFKNLDIYCGQDTYAMVLLMDVLYRKSK